ncbi:MAG: hypothetical protein JWQ27_306 [Ferruginibacter sp.]|nr:hypothetical protein [Ferruginibacter sp.]
MTERLLQYIWQFRYFDHADLTTTSGLRVKIIRQGQLNHNQGPDFLDAQLEIDGTVWAGTVELHTIASEWIQHGHSDDPNYNNVILHVVWKEDVVLNLAFPTLELQSRISGILLERYQQLMQSPSFIPCQSALNTISPLLLVACKDRMLAERLELSVQHIKQLLLENNQHWEETFWWMLARNYGMHVNNDAFEQIARSLPLNLLGKHQNQLLQIEALLFGQAGLLLAKFDEAYPKMLQKEYRFLQKKLGLKTVSIPVYFLRMRPANFPSLRLAQLAAVLQQSRPLFSTIKEASSVKNVMQLLNIAPNDYWLYHYRFDKTGEHKLKMPGTQMLQHIVINTVVPVLFAYAVIHKNEHLKLKALKWLSEMPAEENRISKGFKQLGIKCSNAGDSQALLQLKQQYCDQKNCLQCSIGNALLSGKEEDITARCNSRRSPGPGAGF